MTESEEKHSIPIESTASTASPTASDIDSTRSEPGASDEIDAGSGAPAEPRKKGAGEAFQDLSDSVHLLATRFDEVGDFIRTCKEKLLHEADVYRQDGAKPFLEVLMQLHDLIFRQAQSMESGRARPDPFLTNLFQTLEAELASLGIDVIRPAPGDPLDLAMMKAIATEPCPFWRKPDRVARIHTCGFAGHLDDQWHLLRKAEISVYRK